MKMIKNILFSVFLVAIFCNGCGQSENDEPETSIEQPAEVPVLKDPDDLDYWDSSELVWTDEFEGDTIDQEKWLFETGNNGWGNNELQNYVANDNVEVSNGTLKIIAKKNDDSAVAGNYTSSRLNSKTDFQFGRVEIRAKIPDHKGDGLWPALWMLGSNIQTVGWPACGEIDIMEYVSFDPDKTHFSIHSTTNNHSIGTQVTSGPVDLETIEEEFHNYGILWSSKYVKFYIDDIDNIQLNFRRPTPSDSDNWPFSNRFYLLMNIAVGGNWGGLEGVDDTIFPAVMEVDYVRVYQVK